MIIRTNNKEINDVNIFSETMKQSGKSYPALRIVFNSAVTAEELDELCSGALEILDENGNVVGVQQGYTTRGDHSLVIGKITTPEQERDELAAALAVETAKAPYIEMLTENLDDAMASLVIPLYPTMTYSGNLKRAAVDLWDRADYNPDNASDLWEDINYRDGYRIIPDKITVGLAFADGERGWWKDTLHESTVDNNVYTPDEYADNWKVVE